MDFGIHITILQWNIQGFTKNKFGLEYLVAKYDPEVILLQETHIVNKNKQFLHLPNYKIFQHNKNYNYAKSGVATLIKNTINASNYLTSTNELLHQTTKIHGAKDLYITNIYKETDVNMTANLLDDIPEINSDHHLIAGDLNSQNVIWGSLQNSKSGLRWEQFANDRNMAILNDGSPTLLNTRNTLTSVDVTMATADLATTLTWNCFPEAIASDHFPIIFHNTIQKRQAKFTGRYKESKANWDTFKQKTEHIHRQVEESANINKEAAQIKKIIRKSANESMPTTKQPRQKNTPVWFNAQISRLIHIKNKAWKKFKEVRNFTRILNYKKACAQVRRACKQAKQESWTNFLNSLRPDLDTKTLWDKVRKINSRMPSTFPPIFENGNTISHPIPIANNFAELWSEIGSNKRLSMELTQEKENFNLEELRTRSSNTCNSLDEITLLELNMTLKSAKGTTPGHDKITYNMVRNASSSLKLRLCRLYSEILKTGVYPHDWKHGILAPIPKAGKNLNSSEGYRPISLLPVLSKILDKIITKRLLTKYSKRIINIQHAYTSGHGVHTICHLLESHVKTNIKNQKHSVIISEDLEKAFDRVLASKVIQELNEWGVPKTMLKLIHSFLTNRRITVKVDGFLSNTAKIENGIPQGSPLSVLLFNVYVNTLAKLLTNEQISGINYVGIYADNIFALASGTTEEVSRSLNQLDNKIHTWALETGAIIPANKIEALHVCRKRACDQPNITIRNVHINLKTSMRILGVTFTRNLLWNEHTKKITGKLSKIHNLLKIICTRKKGPHIDTALSICRSLAEGVTQHCITLYGWTSKSNTDKIDAALNKCFRKASGLLTATPIDATRVEARYNDFTWLLHTRSTKLAAKSLTTPSHALHEIFWDHIEKSSTSGKKHKYISSVQHISQHISSINIPIPTKPSDTNQSHWKLTIDISLNTRKKNDTSLEYFKQQLLAYKNSLSPDIIYYTDGSSLEATSSYAVIEQVDDSFTIIQQALLPPYAGVFNAELAAVKFAIKNATDRNKSALICSDSLSVVKSLRQDNTYRRFALDGTITTKQITILWIPAHIGITGNELADSAAKKAIIMPLIMEIPCLDTTITNYHIAVKKDQRNTLWKNSTSFLKSHNHQHQRPPYNKKLSRNDCIKLARMRVGVTLFTTQHHFNKGRPATCNRCNTELSVKHMIEDCPLSGNHTDLKNTLDCSNEDAIKIINDILTKHNKIHDV